MVSERALLARINRKLKAEFDRGENSYYLGVKKTRPGTRAEAEFGEYYTIDYCRNFVHDKNIDLEDWGREMGVLREYEALAEDAA